MSRGPAKLGQESQASPQAGDVWPPVTVVIPCFNAEKWIARAIQSVIDQDYPNKTLIVIDDGSTDRSLEVIKSFGDRLTWETAPNAGSGQARNRGLALSSSEFIHFLDADDYLEGPLISGMVRAALEGDADLTLGPTVIESPDGERSARTGFTDKMPNPAMVRAWLAGQYVQTGGLFWRRAFLNQIGGWIAPFCPHNDVEVALRALLEDARVAISHEGVALWCDHDDSARESRRVDRTVWAGTVELLGRLGRVAASRHPGLELVFAGALYALARRAFAAGSPRAGMDGVKEARALGLRGHPGSPRRALLCRMIGMPLAEYVVISVRLSRSALERLQRNFWGRLTARPSSV